MASIVVCPREKLETVLISSNARQMISLMGPGQEIDCPKQIDNGFLALSYNDIAEPRDGYIEPNKDHIEQVLRFVAQWSQETPLLIHCWMGISRSTAAAVIALASLSLRSNMKNIAGQLRIASPVATPNPLMIALADDILGLNGELIEAINGIGRGAETSIGIPFELSVGFPYDDD